MKVNIGPYKNYFGPYQIAEKIFFWPSHDKSPACEERSFDRFGHRGRALSGFTQTQPNHGAHHQQGA